MFRSRSSSPNRLRIESLEARCNLSAIAPLGEAPAEPAAEISRVPASFFAFSGSFSGGVSVGAPDVDVVTYTGLEAPAAEAARLSPSPFGGFSGGIRVAVADLEDSLPSLPDGGLDVMIANTGGDRLGEDDQHGTHVAGTIGAVGNSGHFINVVDGTAMPSQDDVIVDGRIITAEAYRSAAQSSSATHEVGHALGFYHEHTRPSSSGDDDLLIGGLTVYEHSAEAADLAAPGDSTGGGTLIPVKVKHNV